MSAAHTPPRTWARRLTAQPAFDDDPRASPRAGLANPNPIPVRNVLVTDGEHRSALAIVRSLGRAGHRVTVCSPVERALAASSRFCHASCRFPGPVASPERFIERVRALIDRESIDLVVPTTDLSALPLLRARSDLAGAELAFPDEEAYLAASDKRALLEAARELGVQVPPQVVLDRKGGDLDSVYEFARGRDFDVVVKPSRSAVLGPSGVRRHGVTLVRSEQQLTRVIAARDGSAYPLLIQERISGPGLGVFMLTKAGEVIASFAHRRIREKPPTGGVSVYRESIPLREDLGRAAAAVLGRYAWTGVAMVEFKEEARTGIPYLMEVNGRFWGSLQLAVDAGVDFPALLLRVVSDDSVRPVSSYRTGIRSRWLWGDVDHLVWVLRRGSAHRAQFPEIPSRIRACARFLVPWRPGDRFEVLRASDPKPFLTESLRWIRDIIARRAR